MTHPQSPAVASTQAANQANQVPSPLGSAHCYRLGMAMRMAIGFVALALTILGANLITRESHLDARDHMHRLVVQHEPVVRATELLANALGEYERTVLNYAQGRLADIASVEEVSQRLADAAGDYAALNDADADRQGSLRQLGEALELYRSMGRTLAQRADTRRALVGAYRDQLDLIDLRIREPQERAARFAGGVFTSQALLELSQALYSMREKFSAAIEDEAATPALVNSEEKFRQIFEQHADDLIRSQGVPWLAYLRVEYSSLVNARKFALDAVAELGRRTTEFREHGAMISGILRNQLIEPARRSLGDAQALADRVAAQADRRLAITSLIVLGLFVVIAVLMVLSVTRPVRRLTAATRELASGEVRTRVVRGGVQELDMLAAAFNQMAERLEQAQAEVRRHQAQLEARVAERTRELQHLAHHDPLTQLPNRRHLFARLEAALLGARANGTKLAVLFIDLDNFKTINDSLGHAFGDRVLQAVSERIRASAHFANSFCARLGGDEFTIICDGIASAGEVERMCTAVLEEFQRSISIQGRELRLSVSVGAGIFPDDAGDGHALLRAADSALFRAKELGRNRYSMFTPQLLEAASSRFKLEQALRRAIDEGEFALEYQPQVCFESMRVHSVEALLRWHRSDGQIVPPGDFMEVAEQSGVIMEINDWVLRSAIETAAQWRATIWPEGRLAINVSAHQLLGESFVERLGSLLAEFDLPPSYLEIELTENVLQTGAATISALSQLRALGVSIALDDFGTGYSSLTSLERLPLSRVKIDGSLVAAIDQGSRAPAIVRSIIGLCYSLGLQVTAEGVERLEQLGLLLADRGVQLQGFLISRPLPAYAIPDFIAGCGRHLESLLLAAPVPRHDIDATGARSVRALRTSVLHAAKRETC